MANAVSGKKRKGISKKRPKKNKSRKSSKEGSMFIPDALEKLDKITDKLKIKGEGSLTDKSKTVIQLNKNINEKDAARIEALYNLLLRGEKERNGGRSITMDNYDRVERRITQILTVNRLLIDDKINTGLLTEKIS